MFQNFDVFQIIVSKRFDFGNKHIMHSNFKPTWEVSVPSRRIMIPGLIPAIIDSIIGLLTNCTTFTLVKIELWDQTASVNNRKVWCCCFVLFQLCVFCFVAFFLYCCCWAASENNKRKMKKKMKGGKKGSRGKEKMRKKWEKNEEGLPIQ